MRLHKVLVLAILVFLLGVAAVACGGDSGDEKATATTKSGTPGAVATSTGGGGAGGSTVTVTITDGTATVGQTANVEIKTLGVGAPGLGAYTVDISFDTDIVSATSCASPENQGLGYCNADYDPGVVRTTGAIAEGVEGDVLLGTLTFTCEAAGTSDLTLSVDTLADATIGDPTGINHTEEHGTITCS